MRSNDEIIAIIEDRREAMGWSLSELARRVGMSKSTLSRYMNKQREFPVNHAREFAQVLQIEPEYLLGVVPNSETDFRKELIPIVGRIAAGEPNYAVEDVIGYMSLPPDRRSADGLIYLEVKSDSMDRRFPVGSYVLIDTEASIENGEVAAVKVNGEDATLKQVKFDNCTVMLIPQSHNTDYYPVSLDMNKDEVEMIGKAVGMYQTI